MSSVLNGKDDYEKILRRLNELEGFGRKEAEARATMLQRVSTLEVKTKRQDDDEGKLLAAQWELRNIVVTHSNAVHTKVTGLESRINDVHRDVLGILSLLTKTPEEAQHGRSRPKARRRATRKPA